MKPPTIPMSPTQLPQQKLSLVVDIPVRPQPFLSIVGYDAVPEEARPKRGPSNPTYLGQVEWVWGRWNERLDAYYIHRGRKYWILWSWSYDDNWSRWEWFAAACVPRGTIPEKVAAIHLLIDILRLEAAGDGLDCFHWINEVGLLDVAEWHAIAREVWSDAAPELDNPDGRDD